ncbi:MAG: ribose 5-phosphate isomerase A [Candidatus Algichlamydia australiensis]|nr:ribose 5-phosphate isomerase A [Chlamydiales bacterium]
MNEDEKKAAGFAAAECIQQEMLVGIGTGTTVFYFIEKLGERVKKGLKIQAISSSEKSLVLAQKHNIPLLESSQVTSLDITVDGADEIDREKRMIKGGGGALLREKIIASCSREMIVIIDSEKVSEKLGNAMLPVEIVPFCYQSTVQKLNAHGLRGAIRMANETTPFSTDGGHYIYDIELQSPLDDPIKLHSEIITLPGVVETGLFFHIAGRVIIGKKDGTTEVWQ